MTLKKIFMKPFLFFLLSLSFLNAQTTIFPNVYGEELKSKLVQDYKTGSVLSYGTARDSMYARIDNVDGTITCVYSGYSISVPYGSANPRTYTNGANPIINCEHTWPQSKGASGNAKSDMHHLWPTNANPNSGRGSLPFAEIDDSDTDRWYLNVNYVTGTPSSQIDEYSELDLDKSFEVPEAHKGNVARAMFYFYTMYKSQADSEDPNFFNVQKDVLRKWNMMDPVDEAEITRTNHIARLQEGKPNPFVLDTTLIGRAYFGVTTNLEEFQNYRAESFKLNQNYPNPFNPETVISYHVKAYGNSPQHVKLAVYDLLGREIKTLVNGIQKPGLHKITFNAVSFPAGVYFYSLQTNEGSITRKMLLLP
ncbi:MAG: T9SS C-terminal target domain-containing protein [Calditrichaeota bacterium]|nr:MAG: T9SS C-terminal target domain-containing protein [Calditrichota bacterium]MBL1205700.1 T9SS C-terminal target domain-containing protein [Calditrichota bacterium]NOG45528.1 T9SS type A sorting domain-containing protein [Calditrichota bacterium]